MFGRSALSKTIHTGPSYEDPRNRTTNILSSPDIIWTCFCWSRNVRYCKRTGGDRGKHLFKWQFAKIRTSLQSIA